MCQKIRYFLPGENRTPNGHYFISKKIPTLQELSSFVLMRTYGYYDYRCKKGGMTDADEDLNGTILENEKDYLKTRIENLPNIPFRRLPLYIFENSAEIMNRPFYATHLTFDIPLHIPTHIKKNSLSEKFIKCSGYFFVRDPNIPSGYHLVNFTYYNCWSGYHSWGVDCVIDIFSDSILSRFAILMSLIRIFLCVNKNMVLPWCLESKSVILEVDFEMYLKNYCGTFPLQYPDPLNTRLLYFAMSCTLPAYLYLMKKIHNDYCFLSFDKHLKMMSPPTHDLDFILNFLIRELNRFRMNSVLKFDDIEKFLHQPLLENRSYLGLYHFLEVKIKRYLHF